MKRVLILFFSVFILLLALSSFVIIIIVLQLGKGLPDHLSLSKYHPNLATRFYSSDGQVFCEHAVENRLYVPIGAIPKLVVHAFLSAEDKNFSSHSGISPLRIISASISNIPRMFTSRRPVGGSTITQQIARNLLLPDIARVVSYKRKIKEMILASRIENTFSKDYILELYLNEIFLGENSYGVAAAALAYFNKSLDELSNSEAAFLAGLPKAPSRYNPMHDYDAALKRRNYVIGRMMDDKYIEKGEANLLRREPIKLAKLPNLRKLQTGYFIEEARRELSRRYGGLLDPKGGLIIRTTLDPKIQIVAEKVLKDKLIELDRINGWRGSVGHLSIGPSSWRTQANSSSPSWNNELLRTNIQTRYEKLSKALVLEVTPVGAILGLESGSIGVLPLSEMTWAYRSTHKRDTKHGAIVNSNKVVRVGDVILVEKIKSQNLRRQLNELVGQAESYRICQIPEVSGGLVVMEAHTGRVLALQGGYNFTISQYNRVTQAMRQMGSAFKLFVYLAAIEDGKSLTALILDAPLSVDLGPGLGVWHPCNWDKEFMGPITVRLAFETSRNLAAVRLIRDQVGIDHVVNLAKRFGAVDHIQKHLSIVLGAEETTLMRLATSFAVIVNGGGKIVPTFLDYIQDRYGRVVQTSEPIKDEPNGILSRTSFSKQLTDQVSSYKALSLLQGTVERGTCQALQDLERQVAGKTGTTSNYYDAWFVGVVANLVVGTYIGYDLPRTLGPKQYASVVALPVIHDLIREILKEKPPFAFHIPRGIQMVPINPVKGTFTSFFDPLMLYETFDFKILASLEGI